ncbi:hypothetical protein JCM1841_002257 [Sporobolomyces salmonicolor]
MAFCTSTDAFMDSESDTEAAPQTAEVQGARVFDFDSLDSSPPPDCPATLARVVRPALLPPQDAGTTLKPQAAPRVPFAGQPHQRDPAGDASTAVEEELGLASALYKELEALELQAQQGGSFDDFAVSGPVETLQARAGVTCSAVLHDHERRVLIDSNNYLSASGFGVPNFFLTPDGDIPVDSEYALTDTPDTNPTLRLTADYAASLPRLSRLFLLPPASSSAAEFSVSVGTLQKRAGVLAAAVSEKVFGYYGFIVTRYLEFCDKEGIPLHLRFPVPRQAALLFLSSLAGTLAADTVRTYYNGLRTWHSLHDVELDVPAAAWTLTFKGLKRMQPGPKPQRPPATFLDLLAIRKHLNLANGHDACLWAACCVAFWAMARPGDVTVSRLSAFNPARDATVSDVRFIAATDDFPAHASIHLPFDKVLGKRGDALTLTNQSDRPELDPIVALRNHLDINQPRPSQFLFSSLPWNGSRDHLVPLTGDYFRKKVNEFLRAEHRPAIAGHSWRIGGATFYLLAGVHPDFIRKIGRWRSDAFFRYWREIRVIAALNLQDAACVDVGDAVEPRSAAQDFQGCQGDQAD